MDYLIGRGEIPTASTNAHYFNPPGYYGLSGALDWTGIKLGLAEPRPRELARLLNVPALLGAAFLTLLLARLIWPSRAWLHIAALMAFCLTPVVVKQGAMLHPDVLSLFFATLSVYLAARMVLRRAYSVRSGLWLGAAIGAALLVRPSVLYVAIALGLVMVVVGWRRESRRAVATTALAGVAAVLAVSGWWFVHQQRHYGSFFAYTHTAFIEGGQHPGTTVGPETLKKPFFERRPGSFYVGLGLPEAFSDPLRPAYTNRFLPTTYTEVWGDWLGVWDWGLPGEPPPDNLTHRELQLQSFVGLLPTALAFIGVVWLLVAAVKRRGKDTLAELLIALVALMGLLGFLYYSMSWPSPDGDALKASYMIVTVPAWALAFAFALDRLSSRRRSIAATLAAILLVAAVLDFRFVVFGHSLHNIL